MSLLLTASELSLLRLIRESDLDHGGLSSEELTEEELEVCSALAERGLAEVVAEFGEAPDGEEDEREAGVPSCFRVTGRGVEAIAAAGQEP